MDNLKKITDKIKTFYGTVESHENQIQDLINLSKKPLHSIINQSTIFRAVVPKNSICKTKLEQFEGFRESLIEIILSSLEEELVLLEDIRDKINAANDVLRKEQICIENLYSELKEKNLINISDLNPCCPSLEHIIDWNYDIWSYYHTFYLQISQAIVNADFENEKSVATLSQSFKEDIDLKKQINKIRSFKFENFDFII